MTRRSKRKPWGWGPEGDQEDPFTKTAKRIVTDVKETVGDLKDEPSEVPYRIRERISSYFPWVKTRGKQP